MRKTLLGILMVFVLVAMTACGGTKKSAETVDVDKSTDSSKDSSSLIVYTQKTMDQYFHVALQQKVEEAVKEAGYEVEVANCNNDSTLQNNQLLNFVAKNPKGIIANAVDSDALNDATKAAMDAGIPVVMVDNPASTATVDCTIAFDNFGCGKMAAEVIIEKLTEKYGSPKGRVINVYGAMGSECWRLRKDGFDSVIKEYPEIEYVEVPGEGERSKSQEALTNVIAQYSGEIDAVHCPSDDPGLGCAEALRIADMWYPVGEENHIIFVTGDGEPDAVKGLKEGYYDAIVVEDAYAYGPIAVDIMTQYIFEGKEVPTSGTYTNDKFFWKTANFEKSDRGPVLRVPSYVLDASNVDKEGHWGVAALESEEK